MVDLYEMLAIMCIANRADFKEKLEFVFGIFDFDKNNILE
jgi:hypothetical protein